MYTRHHRLKTYDLHSTVAKQSEVHILKQDMFFSQQDSIQSVMLVRCVLHAISYLVLEEIFGENILH